MPTYEYACKSCGERLEVVQSFTDEPLTRCPACKKKQLRKVFGSIGITFKGSGFYKTDSRNGSASSGSKTTESTAGSDAPSTSGESSSSKETSKDASSTAKDSTAKDTKKDPKKPAATGPSKA